MRSKFNIATDSACQVKAYMDLKYLKSDGDNPILTAAGALDGVSAP